METEKRRWKIRGEGVIIRRKLVGIRRGWQIRREEDGEQKRGCRNHKRKGNHATSGGNWDRRGGEG